jgi:hypothetical protein
MEALSASLLGFLLGIPFGAAAFYFLQLLWGWNRRLAPTAYSGARLHVATPRMYGKGAEGFLHSQPDPSARCYFCNAAVPQDWFPRGWVTWTGPDGSREAACGACRCNAEMDAEIRARRRPLDDGVPVEIPEDARWPPLS